MIYDTNSLYVRWTDPVDVNGPYLAYRIQVGYVLPLQPLEENVLIKEIIPKGNSVNLTDLCEGSDVAVTIIANSGIGLEQRETLTVRIPSSGVYVYVYTNRNTIFVISYMLHLFE